MGGHAEGIREVGESDNLGNTQGSQQTPLGRNQRKKLSLLVCKNSDVSQGWRQRGNFWSPCRIKSPIRCGSLKRTGTVLIWI